MWMALERGMKFTTSLHAVVMAMSTSFGAQNDATGLTACNPCNGNDRGRGCLALLGGLIQEARGAVGTTNAAGGGTGFVKQYTYDPAPTCVRRRTSRPQAVFSTTATWKSLR